MERLGRGLPPVTPDGPEGGQQLGAGEGLAGVHRQVAAELVGHTAALGGRQPTGHLDRTEHPDDEVTGATEGDRGDVGTAGRRGRGRLPVEDPGRGRCPLDDDLAIGEGRTSTRRDRRQPATATDQALGHGGHGGQHRHHHDGRPDGEAPATAPQAQRPCGPDRGGAGRREGGADPRRLALGGRCGRQRGEGHRKCRLPDTELNGRVLVAVDVAFHAGVAAGDHRERARGDAGGDAEPVVAGEEAVVAVRDRALVGDRCGLDRKATRRGEREPVAGQGCEGEEGCCESLGAAVCGEEIHVQEGECGATGHIGEIAGGELREHRRLHAQGGGGAHPVGGVRDGERGGARRRGGDRRPRRAAVEDGGVGSNALEGPQVELLGEPGPGHDQRDVVGVVGNGKTERALRRRGPARQGVAELVVDRCEGHREDVTCDVHARRRPCRGGLCEELRSRLLQSQREDDKAVSGARADRRPVDLCGGRPPDTANRGAEPLPAETPVGGDGEHTRGRSGDDPAGSEYVGCRGGSGDRHHHGDRRDDNPQKPGGEP